ncbi:unnamed protein product [Amoebophrya sp. A120]|nr:unnamed protein product [Amoebophrya sp. A120]|eukprot:GSA120T00017875001.1
MRENTTTGDVQVMQVPVPQPDQALFPQQDSLTSLSGLFPLQSIREADEAGKGNGTSQPRQQAAARLPEDNGGRRGTSKASGSAAQLVRRNSKEKPAGSGPLLGFSSRNRLASVASMGNFRPPVDETGARLDHESPEYLFYEFWRHMKDLERLWRSVLGRTRHQDKEQAVKLFHTFAHSPAPPFQIMNQGLNEQEVTDFGAYMQKADTFLLHNLAPQWRRNVDTIAKAPPLTSEKYTASGSSGATLEFGLSSFREMRRETSIGSQVRAFFDDEAASRSKDVVDTEFLSTTCPAVEQDHNHNRRHLQWSRGGLALCARRPDASSPDLFLDPPQQQEPEDPPREDPANQTRPDRVHGIQGAEVPGRSSLLGRRVQCSGRSAINQQNTTSTTVPSTSGIAGSCAAELGGSSSSLLRSRGRSSRAVLFKEVAEVEEIQIDASSSAGPSTPPVSRPSLGNKSPTTSFPSFSSLKSLPPVPRTQLDVRLPQLDHLPLSSPDDLDRPHGVTMFVYGDDPVPRMSKRWPGLGPSLGSVFERLNILEGLHFDLCHPPVSQVFFLSRGTWDALNWGVPEGVLKNRRTGFARFFTDYLVSEPELFRLQNPTDASSANPNPINEAKLFDPVQLLFGLHLFNPLNHLHSFNRFAEHFNEMTGGAGRMVQVPGETIPEVERSVRGTKDSSAPAEEGDNFAEFASLSNSGEGFLDNRSQFLAINY